MSKETYTVKPYSFHKRVIREATRIGSRIPYIYNTIEIDITDVRKDIKTFCKLSNKKLSLFTYLLHCYAKTIEMDTQIQACKGRNGKLYMYKDVDVFYPIENEYEGEKIVDAKILRKVNKKNPFDLELEIIRRSANVDIQPNVISKLLIRMPRIIKDILFSFATSIPAIRKKYLGTSFFTCLKFVTPEVSHAFGMPMQTIGIYISGISKKVIKVDGAFKERDIIPITFAIDHEMVDGAVFGRFNVAFKNMILDSKNNLDKFNAIHNES